MGIGTIQSKSSAIGVVTKAVSNTKKKNSTSASKTNAKSKSVSAASALKRIKYDFKAISAQVLRAKTSTNASQVVTKARNKLAQLRRQISGSEYDEELMSAITHATQIVRVAKKKKKHLEEEESIERKSAPGSCQCSQIEEKEDDMEDDALAAQMQDISADMNEKMQEEVERLMQQLAMEAMQEEMRQRMEEFVEQMQEAMEEMFEQMEDMSGLEELSDELLPALDEAMDPEDLKQLKQKHRCEEQRDIMEADMKYLKSLFQRLEREKQSSSSVSGSGASSGCDSYEQNNNVSQNTGVFLSIGQRQIEAPMPDVVECTTEGASVDMCL